MPRRSKFQMVIAIFKVTKELEVKGRNILTQIMYNTNINCSQLKSMLDVLVDAGLIGRSDPKRPAGKKLSGKPVSSRRYTYTLTDDGQRVLSAYNQAKFLLADVLTKLGVD